MDKLNNSTNSNTSINSNKPSNLKCALHEKSLKFICYDCNHLLCSKCIIKHLNHQCEHIDNIKESIINDVNHDSNGKDNSFENRIDIIWKSIKTSSSSIAKLQEKDDEISNHFRQIHDYLISQEHKLKMPIKNELHQLKSLIKKNITELKSLVNIIKTIRYNNSANIVGNHDSLSHSSGSSINIRKSNNKIDKYFSFQDDTTDKYHIDSIITSIQESPSLDQFITQNRNTLFFYNHNNNFDMTILELIQRHYRQFNNAYFQINKDNDSNLIQASDYIVVINQEKICQLHQIIQHSIKVKTKPLQTFIFTNDYDGKIILLDVSKRNIFMSDGGSFDDNMEFLEVETHGSYTFGSLVTVGEHIYVFGGQGEDTQNNYERFSIASKSIDHQAKIEGVSGGSGISACHDGGDYIYLVSGFDFKTTQFFDRIDRFNIATMTFEHYYDLPFKDSTIILSFFYQDLLYLLQVDGGKLHIFNPDNKSMELYTNEQLSYVYGACSDGNGNIYTYHIHSNTQQFIKFNVKTKDIMVLNSISKEKAKFFGVNAMIYHKIRPNESVIYLLGGRSIGNFIYSIETNEWKQFWKNDNFERVSCGATIISI